MGQKDPLARSATVFLDEPPVFTERGNVFYVTYRSNDSVFSAAFTPHTLLAGIGAAYGAYNKWAARQRDVAPIQCKKP